MSQSSVGFLQEPVNSGESAPWVVGASHKSGACGEAALLDRPPLKPDTG